MISRLPRKRRTTAPRKPAARTACKLAVLLALAGAPAFAQPPARQAAPARPHVAAIDPASSSPVDTWSVPNVRPAQAIVPVAGQQPDKKPVDQKELTAEQKEAEQKEKEARDKYVRLPATNDVFAFPDDAALERAILERLRQEERDAGRDPYNKYPKLLTFPRGPQVGGGIVYQPKTTTYPPMRVNYEPLYVVHRRLHFEEKNAERYGWDLGIIQPLVSAAYFYKDILLWPNSLASGVAYGFWDTNVGKCLPGSPTPYMLYPPGLTITGTVVEGVFVTGVAFAIP